MTTFYEWDIETLDMTDPKDPEIVDHDHSEKCPSRPLEVNERLVLVRDHHMGGYMDRSWAYVENGKLPEKFNYGDGGNGIEYGRNVPRKFHDEIARVRSTPLNN